MTRNRRVRRQYGGTKGGTMRNMGRRSRPLGNRRGRNGPRGVPTPTIQYTSWPGMPKGDADNNQILNYQDAWTTANCVLNQNCDEVLSPRGWRNANMDGDINVDLIDSMAISLLLQGGPYRSGGRVRRQYGGGRTRKGEVSGPNPSSCGGVCEYDEHCGPGCFCETHGRGGCNSGERCGRCEGKGPSMQQQHTRQRGGRGGRTLPKPWDE